MDIKTKPINQYITVTTCTDPADKLRELNNGNGLIVRLNCASLDKNSARAMPSLVLACADDCEKIKPGDIAYLNENFAFNAVVDGRLVGFIHEKHVFGVLPADMVASLGIKDQEFVPKPMTPKLEIAQDIPVPTVLPRGLRR